MRILIFLLHISFAYGTCNWYYGQWQPDPGQCFELVMDELGISRQLVQYMNPKRDIDNVSDDEIYNVPFSIGSLKSAKWTGDCPPRLVLRAGTRCHDVANRNSKTSDFYRESTALDSVFPTTSVDEPSTEGLYTTKSTEKGKAKPSHKGEYTAEPRSKATGSVGPAHTTKTKSKSNPSTTKSRQHVLSGTGKPIVSATNQVSSTDSDISSTLQQDEIKPTSPSDSKTDRAATKSQDLHSTKNAETGPSYNPTCSQGSSTGETRKSEGSTVASTVVDGPMTSTDDTRSSKQTMTSVTSTRSVTETIEFTQTSDFKVVVTTVTKTMRGNDATRRRTVRDTTTESIEAEINAKATTTSSSIKADNDNETSVTAKVKETTRKITSQTTSTKHTTPTTLSKRVTATKTTASSAKGTSGTSELKKYDCWDADYYSGHADILYVYVKSTAQRWCSSKEVKGITMNANSRKVMKVMKAPDEVLYKYSVRWKENCIWSAQEISYPMGSDDTTCFKIMTEQVWKGCTGNEGVGGAAQAGCLVYQLEAGGGAAQGIHYND
ncbi:hypothetical protein FSARC_10477 [Fusarium sarcochroum]|uniref:Uncharacterized protein n=1 Tax=Fusarium sarcochroum TaxID=1208366 RepID=A0A8H4X3D1_9HYPO|nr:hypothetical protein FSARC_10477 [Fusarium sarcochroum]